MCHDFLLFFGGGVLTISAEYFPKLGSKVQKNNYVRIYMDKTVAPRSVNLTFQWSYSPATKQKYALCPRVS